MKTSAMPSADHNEPFGTLESYLRTRYCSHRDARNINSLQLCEHEIQIWFQFVTKGVVQNVF